MIIYYRIECFIFCLVRHSSAPILCFSRVHAEAERNVCNIVVSTETVTPNHHQSISNAAPHVQTSTLNPTPPQVLTSRTPQPLAQPFYADALQM